MPARTLGPAGTSAAFLICFISLLGRMRNATILRFNRDSARLRFGKYRRLRRFQSLLPRSSVRANAARIHPSAQIPI